MTAPDGPTAVYWLYGKGGELLYIGVTDDVPRRLAQHRRKPWGVEITTHREHWTTSREAALAMEETLIPEELPKWNRAHMPVEAATQAPAVLTLVADRPAGEYAPSATLQAALAELAAAEAAVEAKRSAAHAAVAQDMRDFRVPQTVMAEHVPWTEEHVRKIARQHGVPRLRPGKRSGAA